MCWPPNAPALRLRAQDAKHYNSTKARSPEQISSWILVSFFTTKPASPFGDRLVELGADGLIAPDAQESQWPAAAFSTSGEPPAFTMAAASRKKSGPSSAGVMVASAF